MVRFAALSPTGSSPPCTKGNIKHHFTQKGWPLHSCLSWALNCEDFTISRSKMMQITHEFSDKIQSRFHEETR
ncbi:hypothetical protein Rctr71_023 [Virus Rctr71]|nr:hypothetical protein Rctr71_023 [Virus Rctr71]